jgi:hypothetical protein
MKTSLLTTVFSLALVAICFAQPSSFNYQMVVRDSDGNLITDQEISVRMSIREDDPTGDVVYQEEHSVQTSSFGLAAVQVGDGTSSGDIDDVDWEDSDHYLQVEVDPDGGTDWIDMGTSQLLSVPYALHAETASDVDDDDADPSNELQDLSLNGNTLSISQGNSVELPGGEVDQDAIAKAWVRYPIFGSPNLDFDAYNVASTGTTDLNGVRFVTLETDAAPPLGSNVAASCTIMNDLAPGFCTVQGIPGGNVLTVRTFNADGQLESKEFSLIVFSK